MGKKKKSLTINEWREFLNKKTPSQLYIWLKHLGYNKEDIKAILFDSNIPRDKLNTISFIDLIEQHKSIIIENIIGRFN